MRILLIGEYSNLHNSLAFGLRALGHEVCLVSDGDIWKAYNSDIFIRRKGIRAIDSLHYVAQLLYYLPRFTGYDVVQLINPCFFHLKADRLRPIYRFLRRYNKSVFLGAFGVDAYWIKACLDNQTFRYSDFYVDGKPRTNHYTQFELNDWIGSGKEELNKWIAEDCDGIIACLYEYWAAYQPIFPNKTTYIPLPIEPTEVVHKRIDQPVDKVRFFIGIQKERSIVKGTDVIEPILDQIALDYPDQCEVIKAISVPYKQYKEMLNSAHVLVDQLYSYTPAMNALLGMAKGLIAVSGAEPEHYKLMQEDTLQPIVNILPDEKQIYQTFKKIIADKEHIGTRSADSVAYIQKHHLAKDVAQQYLAFWARCTKR